MAITCKITDGTNEIDFAPNASNWKLRWDEYVPQSAEPREDGTIPPYIIEVLPVIIKADSDNELANDLDRFHDLQRLAERYWLDTNEQTPVWFQVKLDNESNPRQAFIKRMTLAPQEEWFLCITGDDKYWQASITLERHPLPEIVTARILPASRGAATISIKYDYTAAGAAVGAHDINGSTGARIGYMSITPRKGTASGLGRLWIGLRTAEKYGAGGLTNFINVWECEDVDAVLGTDAARAADATASPGGGGNTKVTVTPGTATWAERLSITLGDVTANYAANFGFFLWLLRMKVSAGTWQVQFLFGYEQMTDDEHVRGELIEVTSTDWNIYEMGFRRIPARNLQVFPTATFAASREQTFEIQIWAQRTDGAGTLDLDCIMPVPIDEGFFSAEAMTMASDINSSDIMYLGVSPQDDVSVRVIDTVSSVGEHKYPAYTFSNFYLPPGDGRMIIVHARDSTSVLTDQIDISTLDGATTDHGNYHERFNTLRGGN